MKTPCDEAVIGSRAATSPCRGKTGAWVLAATILASSMAFIDSTVVNVALPALQTNFGANVADVQWVVESYGLTLAALILVGGSMGDLLGRRLMFLLGVIVFAIASLLCGIATEHPSTDFCASHPGHWSCVSGPGQSGADQRIVRGERARPGDRHLVRIDSDHHGDWSGLGRLADPAPVVALGLLHQCAVGGVQ